MKNKKSSAAIMLDAYDVYLADTLDKDMLDTLKQRALFFAVDEHKIATELANQPSMYAYVANSVATVSTMLSKEKMRLDLIEADIKKALKDADPRGGKQGGMTIDQMRAYVQTDVRYLEQQVKVKNLEDKQAHLLADEKAAFQRASMLNRLAALCDKETQMKPYAPEGR